MLEDAAGLDGQGCVEGIDLADRIEPPEREHHAAIGHRAADKPGIAALSHDRHPGLRAFAHDEGDLLDVARAHQRRRRAAIQSARLDDGPFEVTGARQHMG